MNPLTLTLIIHAQVNTEDENLDNESSCDGRSHCSNSTPAETAVGLSDTFGGDVDSVDGHERDTPTRATKSTTPVGTAVGLSDTFRGDVDSNDDGHERDTPTRPPNHTENRVNTNVRLNVGGISPDPNPNSNSGGEIHFGVGFGEKHTYTIADHNIRKQLKAGEDVMVKVGDRNCYVRVTVKSVFETGIRYECSGQHLYTLYNKDLHATIRMPTKDDPEHMFNHKNWGLIKKNIELKNGKPETWDHAHMYRNIQHPDMVCISFGLGKFKGLPPCVYSFNEKTKILLDDKNTSVQYRKLKRTYRDDYNTYS